MGTTSVSDQKRELFGGTEKEEALEASDKSHEAESASCQEADSPRGAADAKKDA